MSDQLTDEATPSAGPPKQFRMPMPGWWPRVSPVRDPGDREVEVLGPEQSQALSEMFQAIGSDDGTKLISVMTSAEDEPRPMGIMYVNHSERAGEVMAGMLGLEGTPEQLPDLAQVGALRDCEVEVLHFDGIGPVSCVTSRREPTDPQLGRSLVRAYLIPEPRTLRAALVVFMTEYYDEVPEALAELGDDIVSGFRWVW